MFNIYNCNEFKNMYNIINNLYIYYLITIFIILLIIYNGMF